MSVCMYLTLSMYIYILYICVYIYKKSQES